MAATMPLQCTKFPTRGGPLVDPRPGVWPLLFSKRLVMCTGYVHMCRRPSTSSMGKADRTSSLKRINPSSITSCQHHKWLVSNSSADLMAASRAGSLQILGKERSIQPTPTPKAPVVFAICLANRCSTLFAGGNTIDRPLCAAMPSIWQENPINT